MKVSMNWPFLKVLGLILIILVSCVQEEAPDEFRFYRDLNFDGIQRSYLINLPPNFYQKAGSQKFPVVVALHGTGGNAGQAERDYGLTAKAAESEYIIVYPEGVPRPGPLGIRTWNAGKCCDYALGNQVDDVGFVSVLIDEMIGQFHGDPEKIYVTGMSNGAMLAYRLACEIPEKISAVAPVSGTLMARNCEPSKPLPILHIHSVLDKIVPFYGGLGLGGYHFASIDSTMGVWSSIHGISEYTEKRNLGDFTYTFWEKSSGLAMELYTTEDGGHSWPGGKIARPGADPPSTAIDATELIWFFFRRH
ncbi:carboxylesterase family protein [Algoriphagus sp. AGSA1]|uniref:alpha/beta hydrolase family esterase n=1 Tax=Algoriphagus sp. AGSA1 TaxID=2907213 RepID=UPI001F4412E9|nr:PHB depolymerase family esterase [Algoriphagus sp. AGSA1]MCE7053862.1 carboxylesterase family protein [Algoriphagus sp. AGSA1]